MKFLITSLLTLAIVFVNAQMDDKFYFPKKDLKPIKWKNYISPYAAKEDIKTLTQIPKLIIHSKKDKEVPYKQGKIIFENTPKPKTFLDFEGEHLQGMKFESEKILNEISKMANLK